MGAPSCMATRLTCLRARMWGSSSASPSVASPPPRGWPHSTTRPDCSSAAQKEPPATTLAAPPWSRMTCAVGYIGRGAFGVWCGRWAVGEAWGGGCRVQLCAAVDHSAVIPACLLPRRHNQQLCAQSSVNSSASYSGSLAPKSAQSAALCRTSASRPSTCRAALDQEAPPPSSPLKPCSVHST